MKMPMSLNISTPTPALLKRFALIYLPVVLVLSLALLLIIRLDVQTRLEKIEGSENSRIEIAKERIVKDFNAATADVRIIAHLPLLNEYLDSGNPAQRVQLEKFFLLLSRETRRYDKVRYLDASGQEVIRINYNNGKPAIVPHELMQNKAGRYFFRDALKLDADEIYVSPLDLNVEQDRLEIPHKPAIRFGTPVFDSAGNKKGIILLNYFGDELRQNFREVMTDGDQRSSMLLNRDGYWLSSDKREDEWGFMLGKGERTFGHDFPDVWRAISAAEQGTLLTDQGLFAYTTVYPLLPGQRSSTGSTVINAPSQKELLEREFHWKVVSFIPHEVLSGVALYNQPGSRIVLVIVYLLLALAAWFVARITLSRQRVVRALAEARLVAASDEKFRNITEAAQDAILMMGADQCITFWNPAAERIFGYTAAEAMGQELHTLIVPAPEHAKFTQAFPHFQATGEGAIVGKVRELTALRKGGEEFPVELSISATRLNDQWHAIGIVRDITERKHHEGRTAALLELSTSAETLDEKTLLQRGLDTVQRLTNSRIGFLHFVSEDQNEIELSTWSTDTLAHYCQAAFDRHYPVSAAGIWVDSVHLKQPVIVNDYATAPNKKGLPEGHSDLQRFISVPILDGELVRMIVGVGNAARDYDEHDVETVKLLGYSLYRTAQRKRMEQTQARLVAILEATPDFVGFADAKDTHILFINKAGRKMTGLSEDEDVTKLKIADVHPEWTNKMFNDEIIPAAIRDGTWVGECAFLNRNNRREIPVMMALISHKAPSGEIEFFSTVSRDITERKQAESKLAEQLDELRRWHEATSGREGRILDLKHEVNELLAQTGQPPRYPSAESDDQQEK